MKHSKINLSVVLSGSERDEPDIIRAWLPQARGCGLSLTVQWVEFGVECPVGSCSVVLCVFSLTLVKSCWRTLRSGGASWTSGSC